MPRTKKQSTEAAVREIRRRTRRKFAPEEKIRIVLEGLRGDRGGLRNTQARGGVPSRVVRATSIPIRWRCGALSGRGSTAYLHRADCE